jgi:hypothetical protein
MRRRISSLINTLALALLGTIVLFELYVNVPRLECAIVSSPRLGAQASRRLEIKNHGMAAAHGVTVEVWDLPTTITAVHVQSPDLDHMIKQGGVGFNHIILQVPLLPQGFSFKLDLVGQHPFLLMEEQTLSVTSYERHKVSYQAKRESLASDIPPRIELTPADLRTILGSEVWRVIDFVHAAAHFLGIFIVLTLAFLMIRLVVKPLQGLLPIRLRRSPLQAQPAPAASGVDLWPSPEDYDISAIRRLIRQAFTAQELQRFCRDRPHLRPILSELGPGFSFEEMIETVISYCHRRILLAALLADIREHNPEQYARYADEIHSPRM